MIGYLFQCREEDMLFTMKNNIRQITAKAMLTGPSPLYEIFHHQIAKCLLYALKNFTNSIFFLSCLRRPYLSRCLKGSNRMVLN